METTLVKKSVSDLKLGDKYWKFAPNGKDRTVATVVSLCKEEELIEVGVTLASRTTENPYFYRLLPSEIVLLAR